MRARGRGTSLPGGRRAATISFVVGALAWIAGGCGEPSVPTSLFLNVETAPSEAPPDELRISLYGQQGVLYLDQRLPAAGALMPDGPGKLGTVTIYLPATERGIRLDVRGLSAGTTRLRAVKAMAVASHRQQAVTVVLVPASQIGDSDGDAVPDPIDNCPHTANPNQADGDGNGVGDACATTDAGVDAARAEAGTDASADLGSDSGGDAATTDDATKDAPGETAPDASTDTGTPDMADASTDVRADGAADVGTDVAPDASSDVTATDAGTPPDGGTATDGAGGTADAAAEAGRDAVPEAAPDVVLGGLLSVVAFAERATVDLATEGTLDWAHWGEGNSQSFDHKATGGGKISNLAEPADSRYTAYPVTYVWSGGTPSATGSTTTGVYSTGSNAVLSISVAADNTARKLRLYVGANDVNARLTAHLSDSAAPDAVFNASGRNIYESPLEITFRAGAANQTLTLTWVPTSTSFGGTISIKAATLF